MHHIDTDPAPEFRTILSHIMQIIQAHFKSKPAGGALPPGEKFARDIGLSPSEAALRELRLPSQSWHHPRL